MAVIKCSECGAMIPEQSAFCPECGAKVKRYCRKCGTLIPDKALFCPKCGTSVKNENKCNKCGTVIPPNASWCPNCGAPVTGNANVQSANAHANNARQQGPGQDVHSHVHGEKEGMDYEGFTFGESIYSCLIRKYATFNGRARRSEYWYFYLFCVLMSMSLFLFMFASVQVPYMYYAVMAVYGIFSLGIVIPSLSAMVRRLHDTGRSGWNVLWTLLPFIGSVILLVFLCQDSGGDNGYGPSPKYR